MSSRRRSSATAGALVAAALLLLVGCAPAGGSVVGGGSESVRPAPPSGVASPSSPPSLLSTVSPSPAVQPSTGGPRPAHAARLPRVPQYRATLAPVPLERPAPVRFSAPSIDVDLPVIRTGVADDGRMQLPETNREVAWYGFGARPGDPTGTTVLAAHVDTRAEGLGPFARLRQLGRGDQIQVSDERGHAHRYRVVSVADVKKSELSLDRLFRRDGDPELEVLTCGGPYSRDTGYRDNIVVTARPS